MSDDKVWKQVALVKDISPHTQLLRVWCDGEAVCLYAVDERIYATQDRCTHGNASLSEGYIEDGLIECPLHQGMFDIETGEPKCPPVTVALKCYDTKVENGAVFLRTDSV